MNTHLSSSQLPKTGECLRKPQNTRNTQKEFLYKDESCLIRDAVFEVYRGMDADFWKRFVRNV